MIYLASLEPSIKDVRTKSRKIDPLPPSPQNVRTGSTPLPPCLWACGHTINFEKYEVFCYVFNGRPLSNLRLTFQGTRLPMGKI